MRFGKWSTFVSRVCFYTDYEIDIWPKETFMVRDQYGILKSFIKHYYLPNIGVANVTLPCGSHFILTLAIAKVRFHVSFFTEMFNYGPGFLFKCI